MVFFFVYVQRRVGIIGIQGPRSDVDFISYVDAGAPDSPSNFDAELIGEDTTTPYIFTILLTWSANTEDDLSHYEVDRSDDGSTFTLVDTIDKTSTLYEDSVEEGGTYFYRFFAVDQSGNRSTASTYTVIVPLSVISPPNPVSILMPQSESGINILWKRPPNLSFNKIQHWNITYIEIDSDNTEISSTRNSFNVNKSLYNDRIDELRIGQKYKVTIQTVDIHNRESSGVSMVVTPQPTPAPRDPDSLL